MGDTYAAAIVEKMSRAELREEECVEEMQDKNLLGIDEQENLQNSS